jgi:hypothetical protein
MRKNTGPVQCPCLVSTSAKFNEFFKDLTLLQFSIKSLNKELVQVPPIVSKLIILLFMFTYTECI